MPSDINVYSAVPQTVDMKPNPGEQGNALWSRQIGDNLGFLYNLDFQVFNQSVPTRSDFTAGTEPGVATMINYGVINMTADGTVYMRLFATGTMLNDESAVESTLYISDTMVITGTGNSVGHTLGTMMEYSTVLPWLGQGLFSATLISYFAGTFIFGVPAAAVYPASANVSYRVGIQPGV